jgi:hypothetical protein
MFGEVPGEEQSAPAIPAEAQSVAVAARKDDSHFPISKSWTRVLPASHETIQGGGSARRLRKLGA